MAGFVPPETFGMIAPTDDRSRRHQCLVDSYFDQVAPYWERIYESGGVFEAVHQDRKTRVLAAVDGLSLASGARVLEVGCGSGSTAVELARRGYSVEAVDTVPAMVQATLELAEHFDLTAGVKTGLADVHSLPYADCTFDVSLAIGVIPWLPAPGRPLRELARVLRSGGYAVVTADNPWGLSRLTDPQFNPMFAPFKEAALRALIGLGWIEPKARASTTSWGKFGRALSAAGFEVASKDTIGFGPFTVLHRNLLPRGAGLRLHSRLQALADRGVPWIRGAGSQFLVVAKKADGI